MAGEVIRDVILKMRIEHADTKALDSARKQAGDTATNAATKAEQAARKHRGETEKLGKEAKAAYGAIEKGATQAASAVDRLTAKEKLLNVEYEKRLSLLTRMGAAGVPGGGVIPGRPGGGVIPGRPVAPAGPAGPGFGAGVEQLSSAFGKIAAPVAIVSMVPAVSQAIGGALRGAAFSLFGSSVEAREKGSPFINSLLPTGQATGSALGDALGLMLNSPTGRTILESSIGNAATAVQRGFTGTAAMVPNPIFSGGPFGGRTSFLDFANRFQEERNAQARAQQPTQFQFLSAEVEARQKHLALYQQLTDRERSLLQTDLSNTEERIRLNQQIIASEEARIDAAKEQFGLLDAQQKQDFIALAEKVKAGGVGSLSKQELQLVQGNAAFTGILSDEAKKAADAAGFRAIIDALDLEKNIRRAESQLEINMQARHEISVKVDAQDAIVDRIREGVREANEELIEMTLERVQNEIRKAAQRGKPPGGPDF